MKDFVRVLRLAKRHSAWILLSLASMVVVAGATVFAFNLLRPIYDELLRPAGQSAAVVEAATGLVALLDRTANRAEGILQSWFGEAPFLILVLALLAITIKNLFAFVARFASTRFGLATIRDLRALFFDSLLAQSPSFFHDRPTAALVSRATNDLQLLREALAERFGDVAQDLVVVPVVLVYLLSLDFRMTIVTAVAAPLLFAPVVYLSRRLRDRARLAQEKTGDVAVVIDETVRGIRVVQNFGMSRYLVDRFGRVNQDQYLASLAARALQAANAPVMEVVGVGAAIGVVAYAALQITAGTMTLGGFSAFVLGAYALYNPFKRINKFNLVLQQAVVAASRVYEIIDAPVAVREPRNPRSLAATPQGVRFENVDFSYRPKRLVLQGFNLDIHARSTVALVGASGVGKSTAAQLIPRFMDVEAGAVRVGEFDVRDLQLASLRSRVALVTQETHLFNDTVRANITCGRIDIDDHALDAAVRVADAESLIRDLPDGSSTLIGENGVLLSGGQRQRLAIARAVLADPSILVLDEATSAIDPESEDRIYRALFRRGGRRTTLVIAHRLATIRRADTIAVLSDGRIVEIGSHDELLGSGGFYRRMVDAQELI
jgi:subfamily B ATP-binding cassette protein MsbA